MLTVLIATRNRARTLPAVLESYCQLNEPRGGWKLLLVDNGSTDGTQDVVRSFAHRLPVAFARNHRVGKNAALNTGLRFVEGDLIVFSDDDAFPRRDWLVRLREAADSRPEFDMFGGVVEPRWQCQPPKWLIDAVPRGSTYTLSEPYLREGPVDAGRLFGPNMAIRSRVFDAGRRFHLSIGPETGRWYAMGSETEFVLRLQQDGGAAWWVESAIVEHYVRREQLRALWLLGRAIRAGRGLRRMPRLLGTASPGPDYPSMARSLVRLGRWSAQAPLTMLACDRKRMMKAWWTLSSVAGYTLEAFHERLFSDDGQTLPIDEPGVTLEPARVPARLLPQLRVEGHR